MTSYRISRRRTLQVASVAGATGMMSFAGPTPLRAAVSSRPKSVIFVFLTGGLSHHDTFDMKPEAPDDIRGEFDSIATRTPGLRICEHLPLLAQRSHVWSLVRSMQTASSGHEEACHMLLTGRLDLPPGFSLNDVPSPNEWPSIPAVITHVMRDRRDARLPPAAVLPQPSVNEAGRVRPGQYAGRLGARWEAWHIDIAAPCPLGNGACPNCFRFDEDSFQHASPHVFETPTLTLPEGGPTRFDGRLGLLARIHQQQRDLERVAEHFDRHRKQAVSVLVDPRTSQAFDVERAAPEVLERYGNNKFGLSCLMARRLVEAGVRYVQVNLGKNSSWDTHRRNFVNLKQNLLPPLDRSISALLDDLGQSGMLDDTLVIVSGEFGRTPKINKDAGRDHWGPCNSLLLAGGGLTGGAVLGQSDRIGAYPTAEIQFPENLASTIYETLGFPADAIWQDMDGRPHKVHRGAPMPFRL